MVAYAHLVPVIDGGILVRNHRQQLLGAEWRAHLAAPGRTCLKYLGQYDPALVSVERAGLLDDPSYLATLDGNHPARRNRNVFPFSAATAASTLDRITSGCNPECSYAGSLLAAGDSQPFHVTGSHPAAQTATLARRQSVSRPTIKFARRIDDLLWRLIQTSPSS